MHTSTSRKPPVSGAPQGSIGIWHAIALYTCAVLGAGVLVLPGQAASLAGPASLIAWGFSCLVGLPLALTFAALAVRHPDAGGVATFVQRAFGSALGGVTGWWYFVAGSVGQTVVPLTAGYYVARAMRLPEVGAYVVALAVLLVAVAANLFGARLSGRLQIALAGGVAAILMVTAVVAIPQGSASAFVPFAPNGLAGIGQAVLVLFFAFAGWEAVAHLAPEFREVRRDLGRATIVTVVVVICLYLAVAFAVVSTGAYGSPAEDRVSIGVILGHGLGGGTAAVMAGVAVVICLGTTTAFIASVSRLGYAMGRDGWLPGALARTGTRSTPDVAILTIGGIGAVGIVAAYLAGWGTEDVVVVPSTLVLATYLVGMAAAIKLLRGRSRAIACLAFGLLVLVAPFAGWHAVIPAVLAAAALAYRWLARIRSLRGTGRADARAASRARDRSPDV